MSWKNPTSTESLTGALGGVGALRDAPADGAAEHEGRDHERDPQRGARARGPSVVDVVDRRRRRRRRRRSGRRRSSEVVTGASLAEPIPRRCAPGRRSRGTRARAWRGRCRTRRSSVARSSLPTSWAAWSVGSPARTTCADSAGVSAPSDHRWTWWTASTRGSASSAVSIASASMPRGACSSSTDGGVADERPRGDEHERGDRERDRGIDPRGAGECDDHARHDHAEGSERVRREVEERAAQVEVVPAHAGDEPRAPRVDRRARPRRRSATPTPSTSARIREATDRLPHDPRRRGDEQHRVRERGEDLGPLPSVGGARRRRPRAQPQRDEGEPERDDVGGEVGGVGEQRERVERDRGDDLHHEQRGVGDEREQERPPAGRRGGVARRRPRGDGGGPTRPKRYRRRAGCRPPVRSRRRAAAAAGATSDGVVESAVEQVEGLLDHRR